MLKIPKTIKNHIYCFVLAAALLITIATGEAQGEYKRILVSAGSSWKYYASNQEPDAQSGTEWYEPSYDDESPVEWSEGFAQLGYSEGQEDDEVTEIPFCSHGPGCEIQNCQDNKYITSYYRHYFNVEDKSDYSSLRVRLLRDDGAVVYLNGNELFRHRLPDPPTEIVYSTLSDDDPVGGSDEDTFYDESVSTSYLQNGTNVLAVEIHQVSQTSSDISFDLVLDDGTTGMLAGPYLIYMNDNETMDVLWILDSEQTCKLEWSEEEDLDPLTGSDNSIIYDSTGSYGYLYIETIDSLDTGTKYYYRMTDGSNNEYRGSFYTAPDSSTTDIKFLAYGDTRSPTTSTGNNPLPYGHHFVCWSINDTLAIDPDYQTFLLLAGDWIYNGNDEDDWEGQYFSRYFAPPQKVQANLPVMGCTGNHEFSGTSTLFSTYLPYDFDAHRYYYFDYGQVRVVVADQYAYGNYSSQTQADKNRMGYDGTEPYDFENNVQLNWIKDTLSGSSKKWNFIVFHQPLYHAGGHSLNNFPALKAEMEELFETGGDWDITDDVDIVFCGHNHFYARCLEDGVRHIITGGGGAPLSTPDAPNWPTNNIKASAKEYHYCEINILDNVLYFIARAESGSIIDAFALAKDGTPETWAFIVKDSSGNAVAWFDNLGNLALKGDLDEESTHTANGSNDEFRVQDSGSNDVAIIDSTDGNMYIDGFLYQEQDMSLLSPEGFIVKNSGGDAVAFIDNSGNVYLQGALFDFPD